MLGRARRRKLEQERADMEERIIATTIKEGKTPHPVT
jgi:hypothetical protein